MLTLGGACVSDLLPQKRKSAAGSSCVAVSVVVNINIECTLTLVSRVGDHSRVVWPIQNFHPVGLIAAGHEAVHISDSCSIAEQA